MTIRIGTDVLTGSVVYPHDASYGSVASWPVPTDDQRMPEVIARCEGARDVAQVLSFARDTGADLAVRGGGHSFAGHSRTEGVLIDTVMMNATQVEGNRAVVGAGATLREVYDALHAEGRTIPAGCGPSVGIAGLTLSGGLGVIGRSVGFTCDSLVGAVIVLADGSVTRCSADRDADLFWALRGGGSGSFGVVTELEFVTIPEPMATGFHVTGPAESAAQVIDAWQQWLSGDAPDEIAASAQLSVPADMSRPVRLGLLGAVSGPERFGVLDDAVRSLGETRWNYDVCDGQLHEAKRHLSEVGDRNAAAEGSPAEGVTSSVSFFVDHPLPRPVVTRLVEMTVDRRPGQHRELDLMPLGGAYNRVSPDATAFVHRRDLFLFKMASAGPESRSWLAEMVALLAPHVTGRSYQNFADPSLPDPLRAYYGDNLARLVDIKGRYDPDDVFHHAQSIPTHLGRHVSIQS